MSDCTSRNLKETGEKCSTNGFIALYCTLCRFGVSMCFSDSPLDMVVQTRHKTQTINWAFNRTRFPRKNNMRFAPTASYLSDPRDQFGVQSNSSSPVGTTCGAPRASYVPGFFTTYRNSNETRHEQARMLRACLLIRPSIL